MESLTIIQHNIIKWTKQRSSELWNTYNKMKPDIILLNATGQKNNVNIKFFGFNTYHRNRRDEEHAGVAILVRKGIRHKLMDGANTDLLAIELETTRGPIIVATTYVPYRRTILPIQELINLARINKPVYILGDFNANHRAWGNSRTDDRGKALNTLINRNLLTHLGPEFITYIHPRGRGTPDLVLGNQKIHLNIAISQGPLTTSDHIPVIVQLATKPIIIEWKTTYKMKKADWPEFQRILTQKAGMINLDNRNTSENDIDESVDQWQKYIKEAMNECIPKSKNVTLPHPKETERQRELQYHYNRLKELGERAGWTMVQRNLFKTIQNQLMEEHIQAYHSNWNKLLSEVEADKKDPKIFWRKIRKLMGGKEDSVPYLTDDQGNKYYEAAEKERMFREIWEKVFQITAEENNAFCRATENVVNNFFKDNNYRTRPYAKASLNRLNHLNELTKPIETYQIKVIIKQFKNKAPGESQITQEVLDNLPMEMIRKLKDIFNLTFSLGYFPKIFKIAILCLIHKEGKDITKPINYKPISLLEVTGKIFEKILNGRLVKFLENNNLLSKNQFGFRKSRGTQMALTTLYEQIATTQKEKHRCNVVCRDVSKAFDKVWHNGLMYKLLHLQLPDILEKTLCSFLQSRQAKIRIDNLVGPPIPLKSGVPQGSILSPTLYIYYIADMPEPGPGSYMIGFADDHTQIIAYPGKSRQMLATRTKREIEKVNEYERKWKIQTNKEKFKLISISSIKPVEIHVDNRNIPFNNTATILGLTISGRGINPHIKQRERKAREQLRKLKRFGKLSKDTKLYLYKALIRPIMEYPAIPICITAKSNMRKLQVLQNTALRAATNNPRCEDGKTNEEVHLEAGFEAMNCRIHELAARIWQKLENQNRNLIQHFEETQDRIEYEHGWWPTVTKYMRQNQQGLIPRY